MVKPLELLQTATTFLSQEANVSESCVYPVIHGLITNLYTAEEDLPAIRNFKVVVATALERRWSFDDIDLTSSPALLSALDPRFRGLKFLSDCDKESMKAYLLQLLEKDSDQSQTQEKEKRDDRAPPVKKTALDVLLGEEEMQCEEDQGVAVEEIAQYFAERPVARETKPLVWWKMNCYRFPRIAELARSTLVPATSTPSERLFSKAGQTISKRRNSLKPKNVDAILFLNCNYKYLCL